MPFFCYSKNNSPVFDFFAQGVVRGLFQKIWPKSVFASQWVLGESGADNIDAFIHEEFTKNFSYKIDFVAQGVLGRFWAGEKSLQKVLGKISIFPPNEYWEGNGQNGIDTLVHRKCKYLLAQNPNFSGMSIEGIFLKLKNYSPILKFRQQGVVRA